MAGFQAPDGSSITWAVSGAIQRDGKLYLGNLMVLLRAL